MLHQHLILPLIGLSGLLAQNYISSTIIGDGRSWNRDGYTNYGSGAASSWGGFNKVSAAWVDSNRSKIYITDDWGNQVRVFDMKTKYLSTLSGDGNYDFLNGNGNVAKWRHPVGLVVDSAGNLYVTDFDNCCIRKVTQAGVTSTFSGICNVCGFADGSASTAQFNHPGLMTIDKNDIIYVAGHHDGRIRKVLPDGSVSTFAGGSTMNNIDGPALSARFNYPYDVKIDASGNLFVADKDNHVIRKISLGVVSLYAGSSMGHADGAWYQARFRQPAGLAIDSNGNVFVSDTGNRLIRKIDVDRSVTTISGTIISGYSITGYADGALSESLFTEPRGIHIDGNGTLYVADWDSSTIRAIYPENQCVSGSALCVGQDFKCRSGLCVERLAGTGYGDFNDGDRLTASFGSPSGLALDRTTGILYIADFYGNRIRKLTPDGIINTHAGDGVYDFVNGPASSARFRWPRGVAIDSTGIVYVSDLNNHCIRKVAANTVSTLAGVCGTSGFNNGAGASALFFEPAGLTLDNSGSLFVAGHSDGRIRKIVLSSLTVSTFAGGSTMGYTNGQGTNARFNYPYDVAFNNSGYLFVADKDNHMIRVISPSGYVSLFAGSSSGLLDGQGAAAMFNTPAALAFDGNGNLYVADYSNQGIRKISPSGLVKSITNSKNLEGDQRGPALKASFRHPIGIEVDGNGTIYVADDDSNKIEIICNMTCINGVADCFNNKCICDAGWRGANCGTFIPTTTTTTSTSTTTTTTTRTTSTSTTTSTTTRTTSTSTTTTTTTRTTSTSTTTTTTPTTTTSTTGTTSTASSTSTTEVTSTSSTSSARSTATTSSSTITATVTTEASSALVSSANLSSMPETTYSTSTTSLLSSGVINSLVSSQMESGSLTLSSFALSTTPSDYVMFSSSTFAAVERTSSEEQSSGISMNSIIIVSAGGGLLLIASTVIITSYINRRRYKKRHPPSFGVPRGLTSDISLMQSAAGYNSANYYSPVSPGGFAGSSGYTFGGSLPYGYNSNHFPSNSYLSSNNSTIELTHRMTQNVSTCKSCIGIISTFSQCSYNMKAPLFIPGYNVLQLGIDYVVPEIIENLGKGGTASIYGGTLINPILVGKHGLTNIAVKVFPEGTKKLGDSENSTASTSVVNDSFLYEVAIMNLVPPNPHIVKFIGYMELPRCAIIMKQYEGSLYALLKDKSIAIDPILCCKIARDVATGMKLIHGMNILHLDIKPHNILWERFQDGSMNFCICDFGFASLVGEGRKIVSGLQVPKSVGITVRYTAPEVFVRLALPTNGGRVNSDLDKKIDVYAFGLSIYEVMLGGSFWKDLEYAAIINKVQSGERPSIDELPSEMQSHADSKVLISIVKDCWKQNPTERPTFGDISNILF